MKKKTNRKSIIFRITVWFSIILCLLMTLTFLIFRVVSASILQKTVRGYLFSSVDENADKIRYLTAEERAREEDKDNVFLMFGDGWIEIDDDFMDAINDVESALYTDEGKMLYGKNPLAREMVGERFTTSRIYRYTAEGGDHYFVYDRKVTGEGLEHLWIRGVVPLYLEEEQLREIFGTSIIFLPVLLLIGILGSLISAARSLQPVRRIEQAASEISEGTDLGRRIDIGDVDQEIYDLAEAFNAMLDRLEHSFASEQQFTSDASHELRTPTAVILAQSEYALEKERSPEEYRKALGVIYRQGRRMNALIGAMLDYSRLELRPENYPLEEMDLSSLVEGCAQDISFLYEGRANVTAEIEGDVRISGNQMLVERAVQNILVNACKYGRENGNVLVRLHTDQERKEAVCEIIDDGPGIPAEEQEAIFERFYRADPSRSSGRDASGIPGAGLGLSLARKIMEVHGGRIDLQSEPGKGSNFSLHFSLL